MEEKRNAVMKNEIGGLLPIEQVQDRINTIRSLVKSNMKEGVHFGTIPGCGEKPALLKPGAEMINTLFQFSTEYHIETENYDKGHKNFNVKTCIYHIPTGAKIGEGVGSCSTLEKKYRYRRENTGQVVPKEYWDSRDTSIIGGLQFSVSKIDGTWYVMHEVEYNNPADYYNTCVKMGKKRSLIDAILTATGASELFTQDIEEMEDLIEPKTTSQRKEKTEQFKNEPPKKQEQNMDEAIDLHDLLNKMAKDENHFSELLERFTSFTSKSGDIVPGVSEIKDLSPGRLSTTLKIVKKEYEKRQKSGEILPEADINEQ